MADSAPYWVLAFYSFVAIEDPTLEVQRHFEFFKGRDATSRIYFSKEGVNGQLSAFKSDAEDYMSWMRSDPRFKDLHFKIHTHHENAFPKLTIKVRPQLVAFDRPYDMAKTGIYVAPSEWKQMLQSDEEYLLIDVRNDYEWKIGHFEGATLPPCNSFREFPAYTEELLQKHDPKKTKVMMYCTGGIRCEIYSSYLKERGFENVYQLHGGVVQYGQDEGNELWKGKLFVFDDRLAVTPSEQGESSVVAQCHHCQSKSDTYYNCANMDCNELFLSCSDCIAQWKGCCCEKCLQSPRLRVYRSDRAHKPFRKKHLEECGCQD